VAFGGIYSARGGFTFPLDSIELTGFLKPFEPLGKLKPAIIDPDPAINEFSESPGPNNQPRASLLSLSQNHSRHRGR
jgi:hypothetical protein